MALNQMSWALSAILAIGFGAAFFHSRFLPSGSNMKTATQFLIVDLGIPHPYQLTLVPQYTMVYKTAEFLVRRDSNQQLVGGLAKSWDISQDRRSIRFNLRADALYSADEIAQSLTRLLKAGQTTHSNIAIQTQADWIHVLDKHSIEIKNTRRCCHLSPLVMADAAILPDDHWVPSSGGGREQVDWGRARGPYVLTSGHLPMGLDQCVVFSPNPRHYLYKPEQVAWRLCRKPSSAFNDLGNLARDFKQTSGFVTVLFSDFYRYTKSNPGQLKYYQTRPNGISFLHLNTRAGVFSERRARRALLKRVLNTDIQLVNPSNRARQIAQPGLVGQLSETELHEILAAINTEPEYEFKTPIRWSAPRKESVDQDWLRQLTEAIGLPHSIIPGPQFPDESEWATGQYDVSVDQVGMSDTDPISGATFLFSPSGDDADLPDGSILRILNSAKDTTDRESITKSIRTAFRRALEEAVVVPLFYNVNRHYHSDDLELNITDSFSESIDIENLRLKTGPSSGEGPHR